MESEEYAREAMRPTDVELADAATIFSIHRSQQVSESSWQPPEPVAPRRKRSRCACGKCWTCLETARWDSIFQEKFADPTYYELRHPTLGSSLRGL